MNNLLSFEDALIETEIHSKTLLIGNGFSIDYFRYKDLFQACSSNSFLDKNIINLFYLLGTTDFEKVLRSLDEAYIVAQAYENSPHADEIKRDTQALREALIKTIKSIHPSHESYLGNNFNKHFKIIKFFNKIFTLNYDLLLYWLRLQPQCIELSDGFGLGSRVFPGLLGPFRSNAACSVYNLHGGLHIFEGADGEAYKVIRTRESIIGNISYLINNGKYPIYVAEGSSQQKLYKINSSYYLRNCYDNLMNDCNTIFIYGHSADTNDEHIYRAIFCNKARKYVYFGVYDIEHISHIKSILLYYKNEYNSGAEIKFFDSRSVEKFHN